MMKRWVGVVRVVVAISMAVSLAGSSTPSASGRSTGPSRSKLDRALAGAASRTTGASVRVIVTAAGGQRSGAKQALGRHARSEIVDQPFIDALVADVSDDALADLAADPRVAHVSLDAPVQGLQATT
jgi:hypothetical protein